jgi:hypothetical protein
VSTRKRRIPLDYAELNQPIRDVNNNPRPGGPAPRARIEYDGATGDEWSVVLRAMHSGEPAQVSVSIADYFRRLLPPAPVAAERGACRLHDDGDVGFAFAEGAEMPTVPPWVLPVRLTRRRDRSVPR